MKNYGKVIFAGMLLAGSLSAAAQQIPKKLVLVEKWSGTWCYPCTGAARAMEQMDSENRKVALISYQIEKYDDQKEKFETEEGRERMQYYGDITGYPTTCFDGVEFFRTGNSMGTIYPGIFPLYEKRVGMMTSFDINVASLEKQGDGSFTAKVVVDKVATYSSDKLKLRFALVEKMIPEPWNGMEELHYVQRDMFPDAEGVLLDFSSGDRLEIEIEGMVSEKWNEPELEVICFVQDDNTKEVLQTVSYPFSRTEVQKKGSCTENCDEINFYWYMVSGFHDTLKNYNVYSLEGELLGQAESGTNIFVYKNNGPGQMDVRVSAVYENAGETALSEVITGVAYRNTLAPTPKYLRFEKTGNGSKGTLAWDTQDVVKEKVISYEGHNEVAENEDGTVDAERRGGFVMTDTWVVQRLDNIDAEAYRGLEVSQLSFVSGNVNAGYQVGIFVNGELAYSEEVQASSLAEGHWYTHTLAKPFFISGKDTVDIGYRISDLSTMPIYIDEGPVLKPGKTNLIGVPNGKELKWSELYEGNNLINIGFTIPETQGELPVGTIFKGYNVYCNGQLVNNVPVAETSMQLGTDAADGLYTVSAVYEECESLVSNAVAVGDIAVDDAEAVADVVIVADGALRTIYIIGEYASCEVYDLCGRIVASADGMTDEVCVAEEGVYLVRVSLTNGKSVVKKVVMK